MDDMLRDLRHAIRSLGRHRSFTAIAVGTIALGIGANTAIFSVVRAVLLRPLPYEDPGRLVAVWSNLTNRNQPKFPLSPPDLRDFQEQATTFEDLAGVITFTQTLTGGDSDPEQIDVAGTTPNLLDVLGLHPMIGRGFVAADAEPVGQQTNAAAIPPASVILSYELWQRRFGGDRDIVGRSIELNNNTAVVIGVMPPGAALYFGPDSRLTSHVDLWTALRIDVAAWPARRNVIWAVVGRLKPNVTVAQVRAEMDRFTVRMREESSLRETAGFQLDVIPMLRELTAGVRPVVLALFGAVAFVLLIACANVSNLLLVRASAREREFAIRAALGGSRGRIVRQLLMESLVLGLVGGALGLMLAVAGNRALLAFRPANLPRIDTIHIDLTVLAFTALASLGAALLFGLMPAIQVSKPQLTESLSDRGRSSSLLGQRKLRNGLVITEVALSLVLMIGAGLMIRSFVALQRVEPGYDPTNLLTFNLALPGNRYSDSEMRIFYGDLEDQARALPGVTDVTAAFSLPLQPQVFTGRYGPLEALTDASLYGQADYRAVRPGYFKTMRTAFKEGRLFSPADFADSTPVAVVDELTAARLAPGESAVGKRMLVRITTLDPQEVEVIGVVEHQRSYSLAADGTETIYVTNRYAGTFGNLGWVIRTTGDPVKIVPRLRQIMAGLDPLIPISDLRTMDDRISEAMTGTRFALALIGLFGFIALALASGGIYGVLSYTVRQRAGEIGVRMALGARSGNILGLVVRQGMKLTGIGLAVGLVASFWATRLMQGLLVEVPAADPVTYIGMAAMFVVVAIVASWAPARRATLIDPVVALRDE
ncbi:MAG: ABC transporter permease [Gemmatimonadales bacterium]